MSVEMVRGRRDRARWVVSWGLALYAAFGAVAWARADATAIGEIDFSRDIRPILSDNCFFCHGPDPKHREADLRLDLRESALAVVQPGNSAESELVRRINSSDPDELMPPAKSHRELTAAQKALIAAWVDRGAPWGEHWAFRPLKKPEPPVVAGKTLAPIDAFVQSQLARQGLAPAAVAPPAALVRRVSLDLTGLPPTPEQTRAFLSDADAAAYEKLVDRLLASPAFGERMAWDWLDAARYADTNGYQGDNERTMWPWRDWVVDAFNRNLPYDAFTVWQLAGDQLPDATIEQKLATGFCRNHMINGEGGRIAEENRVDYVMDMAETTATIWLGLTTNCCRCHDHKFDPLTQRDYYRLFAFFNQTPVTGGGGNAQTPPVLERPTEEQTEAIARLERELATLRKQLDARGAELSQEPGAWEDRLAAAAGVEWKTLKPGSAQAEHQTLRVLEDDSILAEGENPLNDTYVVSITAPPGLPAMRAVRLEALRDPSLTHDGLSRADSGNFVLNEFEVTIARGDKARVKPVKIASAVATFEQPGFNVGGAIDGNKSTGWAVWDGHPVDQEHEAVFLFVEPLAAEPGSVVTFTLRHDSQHAHHVLGRFRLSVTSQPNAQPQRPAASVVAALRKPAADRSKGERTLAAQGYRQVDPAYRKLADEEQQTTERLNTARKNVVKVMVMEDMPKPRQTFILERGLYNKPGDEVTAGAPASLPPLATPTGEPGNRLSLARWLVAADQPLTARVTVNRLWQQLFGIGLVKTTEDFGVQGEMPKHLELLDWLAADFRDSGWDVKRLLRQIVISHTYRQSSRVTPELAERDPQNRLLARGPRFRMPSWMLRDQALAASGLLARKVGGPPVNGYQPPGIWEEATFGVKQYQQDHGDALYRRSLYIFWRRIIGPTVFFDTAARQTCSVKTLRTNTPLQSLLTLNDVTYVEAARALAQRALTADVVGVALAADDLTDEEISGDAASGQSSASSRESSDDERDGARLALAFQRVLCRDPSAAERTILLAGLARSREQFQAEPDAAQKLLALGESPRDTSLDFVEHASWTALCLAIFNLDETLTKE